MVRRHCQGQLGKGLLLTQDDDTQHIHPHRQLGHQTDQVQRS